MDHILQKQSIIFFLFDFQIKLQYFGHLTQRTDSLEKTLMLGKVEGRRRRGRQRMRWFDGITDLTDMSLSKLWSWCWTGKPCVLQSTDTTEQLNCSDQYLLENYLAHLQYINIKRKEK